MVWTRYQKKRLLTYFSLVLFIGIIAAFLLTTVVFAVFSLNLPDPNKVIRREGLTTIISDRNGKVLYDLYQGEHRIPLDLGAMPTPLRQATIAIEDKDFYKHQGFDPFGFLRAVKNIVTLRGISGGSTLTQQLVKTVLLSSERTLTRKIKELILASEIEKKFTKDQILQMYLNEVPYGGAAYGVESAAQTYFGKPAKELTLVEAAILAGLPQQPSNFSPFGSKPQGYVNRTRDVLRRMREDGYITSQTEHDALKELPLVRFATQSGMIKAPHFVFYIKDQLVQKYGEAMVESGGLRVTTTLDWDLQKEAERIVNEEVKKIKSYKVGNGAAVALNPQTGEILSMVGSYDYFDKDYGSFNVATALRQPGSAGKPFVYATAFARGYTPASLLMDVKTDYPSNDPKDPIYTPENYDGKYRGPTQLRFALGNSINTIAVKLTALIGVKDIMTNGFNAGITTWEPTEENMKNVGLSLALGGREVRLLELTGAYGVLATGGVKNDLVSILKVTDINGKTLYEYRPTSGRRIFSPEVAFLTAHILSDNNARKDVFGESNLLLISGKTVAAKTGTTDKKRDNWTFGFTPTLTVGVWVGNNNNTVMDSRITSGVTGAAPIWNKVMKTALAKKDLEEFKKPDTVTAVSVDSLTGGLPHGSDPTRSEYFLKGTEPTSITNYQLVKISKANGKLANDIEIKAGDYEEKEFLVFTEEEPITWAGLPQYTNEQGKNHWQDAINRWLADNKKDDSRFHPPADKSDARLNDVVVNVETPKDGSRIDGTNNIGVKARAFSQREIVKFTVSVDGAEKIAKSSDTIDEPLTLADGKHELKFRALDSGGNAGEATLKIGINTSWE